MSNLTDLLPAGAGGKQVSFVASGTIGNGVTVGLNLDGTVEAVAETAISQAIGSSVEFQASGVANNLPSAIPTGVEGKVVFAYRDSLTSNYGVAIVGTINTATNSITFGSKVVFQSAYNDVFGGVLDEASGNIVILFKDSGDNGRAVVGTVSGTSISFGTSVAFSTNADPISGTYDSTNNKVIVAYTDRDNLDYGKAKVGTVSGTSISFGTEATFNSGSTSGQQHFITYDSANEKAVIGYTDGSNSNYGTAVVGTVSGTSISFGSETVFASFTTSRISVAYDQTSEKVLFAYNYSADGQSVVGSVSGTSISFGTEITFETGNPLNIAAIGTAKNVVIAYEDDGDSEKGKLIVGTITGTSVSYGSAVQFDSGEVNGLSIAYEPLSGKTVIFYVMKSVESGKGVVFQSAATSTNNTDFIGISDAAISDTASGSVTIKGGISTNVTGLTPNATYYVQSDGTLSTTASDVLAGKALSSTSINLDYTT